jgi:hypothetical protein
MLPVRRGDESLRWSQMAPEQGKCGSYSATYGPPETRIQTPQNTGADAAHTPSIRAAEAVRTTKLCRCQSQCLPG